MTQMPSQIWICAKGSEVPDWVVSYMTTAEIADDGSFEIEASDGRTTVERGMAVFDCQGQVFACLPKHVQQKLATAAGDDNEVVAQLAEKTATMRKQHVEGMAASPSSR